MKPSEIAANFPNRFDADPQVKHHFSDGVYAKQMHIPKGFTATIHVHNYTHLSILAKGEVIVSTDENARIYKAPACIEIGAGVYHSVEALEDSAWFCIHQTDEKDTDKIDAVLLAKGN